jgi:hypothetical protein
VGGRQRNAIFSAKQNHRFPNFLKLYKPPTMPKTLKNLGKRVNEAAEAAHQKKTRISQKSRGNSVCRMVHCTAAFAGKETLVRLKSLQIKY